MFGLTTQEFSSKINDMMKYTCLIFLCTLSIIACNNGQGENASHEVASTDIVKNGAGNSSIMDSAHSQHSYRQEVADWRANRISALKRARSWTTLVGLTWLNHGENTFGSAILSDVRISEAAPEDLGVWTLTGDSVWFKVEQGVDVRLSDQSAFHEGPIRSDAQGDPDLFRLGSLYWTIIKRSENC